MSSDPQNSGPGDTGSLQTGARRNSPEAHHEVTQGASASSEEDLGSPELHQSYEKLDNNNTDNDERGAVQDPTSSCESLSSSSSQMLSFSERPSSSESLSSSERLSSSQVLSPPDRLPSFQMLPSSDSLSCESFPRERRRSDYTGDNQFCGRKEAWEEKGDMNRMTTDLRRIDERSPRGGNDRGRGKRSMTHTQSSVESDAGVNVSKKSDSKCEARGETPDKMAADRGKNRGKSRGQGSDRGRGRGKVTRVESGAHVPGRSAACSEFEPNKLLVRGLCDRTTTDGLLNFVEAMTKDEVQETVMLEEGKALVTLKELTGK